jgi:ribosomal protein S18 acetylase RimI-like enzyme
MLKSLLIGTFIIGASIPFYAQALDTKILRKGLGTCKNASIELHWMLQRLALANAGRDTCSIQAYLGHKDIRHTVRYTELSPTRFKDFWRWRRSSHTLSVTPRKARQADGPRVFELIWSARNWIPLNDKFYSDDNKAWISKECRRGRVWIVEQEGVICGALYIQHSQLFYLVVAEAKRRLGIGRLLLSKGKKKGKYCRVSPSNYAVIRLLESEGFVHNAQRLAAGPWIAYDYCPLVQASDR